MLLDLDSEEQQKKFLLLLLALATRSEQRLLRRLTPALRLALLRAIGLVDDLDPDGQFRVYDWARRSADLEAIERELSEVLESEIPSVVEDQKQRAGQMAATAVGLAAVVIQPINREQIRDQASRTARRIRIDIDKRVRAGIFRDEPTSMISKGIGQVVGRKVKVVKGSTANLAKSRMKNLIAGEVWRATTGGTSDAWSDQVDVEWVWNAILDPKICPVCAPKHRTIVRKPSSFVPTTYSPDLPPVHPNCRCMIFPRRQ